MTRTLTGKMTLWFSALFGILSLLVFVLTYMNLRASLSARTDQHLAIEALEVSETIRTTDLAETVRLIKLESETEGVSRIFYRLFSPHSELLAASDLSAWPDLREGDAFPPGYDESRFQTFFLTERGANVRMITQPLQGGQVLQIGQTLEEDEELLEDFRNAFGLAIAGVLFGGSLIGYLVARRSMRGLEGIRETADRISRGDLSQRASVEGECEEVENLARAFNHMQERIESLIGEMREVSNNIAHDLRSPLTRIRGLAETTLIGSTSIEDYREMAGAVVEESDSLVSMVNTMLEIAETDAGIRPIPDTAVDLGQIAADVGELFLPVAEDKNIRLTVGIPDQPLLVTGDRARLQRAVANLLDNAIKYTPAGGRITISAERRGMQAVLSMADSGQGIREEDIDRIFDRFFRGDQSRSTPGTGLGLSLVRAVVRAHGGEVSAASALYEGSTFRISLPCSAKEPTPTDRPLSSTVHIL